MTARQHLVYRVDIGGRVYVGMTRQTLRQRMTRHRSDKTSKLGGFVALGTVRPCSGSSRRPNRG